MEVGCYHEPASVRIHSDAGVVVENLSVVPGTIPRMMPASTWLARIWRVVGRTDGRGPSHDVFQRLSGRATEAVSTSCARPKLGPCLWMARHCRDIEDGREAAGDKVTR